MKFWRDLLEHLFPNRISFRLLRQQMLDASVLKLFWLDLIAGLTNRFCGHGRCVSRPCRAHTPAPLCVS